jgi:hypothetical protein
MNTRECDAALQRCDRCQWIRGRLWYDGQKKLICRFCDPDVMFTWQLRAERAEATIASMEARRKTDLAKFEEALIDALAMRKERDTAIKHARNLIARIDRDGGTRQKEETLEESADRADCVVIETFKRMEEVERQLSLQKTLHHIDEKWSGAMALMAEGPKSPDPAGEWEAAARLLREDLIEERRKRGEERDLHEKEVDKLLDIANVLRDELSTLRAEHGKAAEHVKRIGEVARQRDEAYFRLTCWALSEAFASLSEAWDCSCSDFSCAWGTCMTSLRRIAAAQGESP